MVFSSLVFAANRATWNVINSTYQTIYQVNAGTTVFTDSLNVYPSSAIYNTKIMLDGISGNATISGNTSMSTFTASGYGVVSGTLTVNNDLYFNGNDINCSMPVYVNIVPTINALNFGNGLLSLDNLHGFVGINNILPNYALDVAGAGNITTDFHVGANTFLGSGEDNEITSNAGNLYIPNNLDVRKSGGGHEFLFLNVATSAVAGTGMGMSLGSLNSPAAFYVLDGSLLLEGSGDSLRQELPPATYADRLFWYPGKIAFRAGHAAIDGGAYWADDKIGEYSTAFGYDNTASGSRSFATGTDNTALSAGTVAIGTQSDAKKEYDIAIGQYCVADGSNSLAMGNNSTSGGKNSVSLGNYALADYYNNIAIGNNVQASGSTSCIVFGEGFDEPGTNNLNNSIAHSLMIGFLKTTPTLFVSSASVSVDNTSMTAGLNVSSIKYIAQLKFNDGTVMTSTTNFGSGGSGGGGDSLGSHIATMTLNMNGFNISSAAAITAYQITVASPSNNHYIEFVEDEVLFPAAQSGSIRLSNAQTIQARTVDNDADVTLLQLDAANNIRLGTSGGDFNAYISSGVKIGYGLWISTLASSSNSNNIRERERNLIVASTNTDDNVPYMLNLERETGYLGVNNSWPSERLTVGGNIANAGYRVYTSSIQFDDGTIITSTKGLGGTDLTQIGSDTGTLRTDLLATNLSTGTLVKKSGDTMSGLLNMGNNIIKDIAKLKGYSCEATGDKASAIGLATTASGDKGMAIGSYTSAAGFSSLATGEHTVASGYAATSMGEYTEASGYNSVVMGFNATAGPANLTFTIGEGADVNNRLLNNIADSLMVGFLRTTPTLFVSSVSVEIDGKTTMTPGLNVSTINYISQLNFVDGNTITSTGIAQIKIDTGTLDTNKLDSSSATVTYFMRDGTQTVTGSTVFNSSVTFTDGLVAMSTITASSATFSGNVAIGTLSPLKTLHLLSSEPSYQVLLVRREAAADSALCFRNGSGTNWTIGYDASYGFAINNEAGFTDGNDFVISPTRNIGIGTVIPSARLSVWSNSTTEPTFISSNTFLRIEHSSAGVVGIGIETANQNPTVRLDVNGAALIRSTLTVSDTLYTSTITFSGDSTAVICATSSFMFNRIYSIIGVSTLTTTSTVYEDLGLKSTCTACGRTGLLKIVCDVNMIAGSPNQVGYARIVVSTNSDYNTPHYSKSAVRTLKSVGDEGGAIVIYEWEIKSANDNLGKDIYGKIQWRTDSGTLTCGIGKNNAGSARMKQVEFLDAVTETLEVP